MSYYIEDDDYYNPPNGFVGTGDGFAINGEQYEGYLGYGYGNGYDEDDEEPLWIVREMPNYVSSGGSIPAYGYSGASIPAYGYSGASIPAYGYSGASIPAYGYRRRKKSTLSKKRSRKIKPYYSQGYGYRPYGYYDPYGQGFISNLLKKGLKTVKTKVIPGIKNKVIPGAKKLAKQLI